MLIHLLLPLAALLLTPALASLDESQVKELSELADVRSAEEPKIRPSRNGRLFYISSTSCTTTISTQSVCYVTAAAITAACKKRRRRAIIHSEPKEFEPESLPDPSIASSSKEDVDVEEDGEAKQYSRQGKFLLYWMTTTSISTLTSFTATSTLGSLACTPSGYGLSQCGKRK